MLVVLAFCAKQPDSRVWVRSLEARSAKRSEKTFTFFQFTPTPMNVRGNDGLADAVVDGVVPRPGLRTRNNSPVHGDTTWGDELRIALRVTRSDTTVGAKQHTTPDKPKHRHSEAAARTCTCAAECGR